VAEQRYRAVLAVISDGLSVSQVAEKVGVSRQTLDSRLARYEAQGLEGLMDRSHRPVSCRHQMPALVEAALVARNLQDSKHRPVFGVVRLPTSIQVLCRGFGSAAPAAGRKPMRRTSSAMPCVGRCMCTTPS
jgi:transposase-like protein